MKTSSLGILAVTAMLSVIFCMPAQAVQDKCSFRKNIAAGGATFSVSSRPASGCNVQILDILMQRNGKKIARYRSDVDEVAYSVLAGDLNNDSVPELVVLSKTSRKPDYPTIDLYRLDGNALKKISLPPLEDNKEYGGGDEFWIDGRQLVRSFPLYGQDKQQNGTRTLKYEMVDNKIALYVQSDAASPVVDLVSPVAPVRVETEQISQSRAGENKTGNLTTINEIVVGETGITLKTDAPVGKYRTMRLDKPERIAIDFPKGKNGLKATSFAVGKFGVTKIRIGNNKGFVRFVFDAKERKFPLHVVKPASDGLLIDFTDVK